MAGSSQPDSLKPCKRCKIPNAPLRLRDEPTCQKCYSEYIADKLNRRIGILHKETRKSHLPEARRYAAGLSFGSASSAMTHLLNETAKSYGVNQGSSPFEVLFVHIDTDLSGTGGEAKHLMDRYRQRFEALEFEVHHLSEVLKIKTIDWASLPVGEGKDDSERLRRLFENLPSVTSRTDVLRQLVRHLLLHIAMERGYTALLLGHTTTALAALTLAEVANGRGFAVPWQVNDGPYKVCTYDADSNVVSNREFHVHYLMREIYLNEAKTYVDFTLQLQDLKLADASTSSNVVSHKDTSIDEVMARYFQGVEGSYAGIVANVVRTAGKLERMGGNQGLCGLCGVTLDEQGDSRWAGEIGDDDGEIPQHTAPGKLCYGCKRSINE